MHKVKLPFTKTNSVVFLSILIQGIFFIFRIMNDHCLIHIMNIYQVVCSFQQVILQVFVCVVDVDVDFLFTL